MYVVDTHTEKQILFFDVHTLLSPSNIKYFEVTHVYKQDIKILINSSSL